MNWIDIVILAVLIACTICGIAIGLIKSIFSLAGLILGVILAGQFYVSFASVLSFLPGDIAPRIAAFIIIFLAVMLIATLLGILLTKLISAVMLGWINRLGGAVIGTLLGAIFVAAILAIWVKVVGPGNILVTSKLAPILLDKLPLILGLLPSDFKSIRDFFR